MFRPTASAAVIDESSPAVSRPSGSLAKVIGLNPHSNQFRPNTNRMKTHIIRWVSSVTGGIGAGKKCFEQAEAETLAAELNASYPEIHHEAIPAAEPVEPESVPPHADGPSAALGVPATGPQTEAGLYLLPKSTAEFSA